MPDIAQLDIRITTKDVKDGTKELERLEKQGAKSEKSVNSLTSSFKTLRNTLAALGVIQFGRSVLSQFAAFDKGLIGVRKTTGIAGAELKAFGEQIVDLSLQMSTSTTELLAIAQAAGQLGVTGSANILKFSKTVAQLGMASDLAGEEAATTLARLLTVTGESASQVDVLGSVIVALGNNMAATESEIARMATEVGQATAAFTVSSAEAAALGAAMRSLGIRAELGGSSVGRVFRMIEEALNSGGPKLEALTKMTGESAEQLRKAFATDSTQAFTAFINGLGRAIESGQSAAAVLERFGLKGEEVLKVLPALASRSDVLSKALGIASDEVKNNTALTNEALQAQQSFSAQMQIVGNEIDATSAAIGRELAPSVVSASRAFAQFVSSNKGKFEEFARDVGEFAEDLGPIASDIGNILSTTLRGWNNLPTVVQEIGVVGALVGGAKAKIAITLIAAAMGQLDKLNKQAAGVSDMDKQAAILNQELNFLKNRQEALASLSGADVDTFGPRIKAQIAESKARVAELQKSIFDAQTRGSHDLRELERETTAATGVQEKLQKTTAATTTSTGIDLTTDKAQKALVSLTAKLSEMNDVGTSGESTITALRLEYNKFAETLGKGHPKVKEFSDAIDFASAHYGKNRSEVAASTRSIEENISILGKQIEAIKKATDESGTVDQNALSLAMAKISAENAYKKAILDGVDETTAARERDLLIQKASIDATGNNLQVQTEFSREYMRLVKGDSAAQMAEIERRAKAYRKAGNDAKAVAEWEAKAKLDASRNWYDGAIRYLDDYAYEATDMAANMEQVFSTAFSGMEDALVDFVQTGKLDFKSLADSIIADLIRIQVRESITGPLSGGLSDVFKGLFSAHGNVLSGTGISSLSNGIYSQPTYFGYDTHVKKFASGGVLGEAGPEAVMPLTRTASGDLGVKTDGGTNKSQTVTLRIKDSSGNVQGQQQVDVSQFSQTVLDIVWNGMAMNESGRWR